MIRTSSRRSCRCLLALLLLSALMAPVAARAGTSAEASFLPFDIPSGYGQNALFDVYGDVTANVSIYVPEGLPLILLGTGLAAVVLLGWKLRNRKSRRE